MVGKRVNTLWVGGCNGAYSRAHAFTHPGVISLGRVKRNGIKVAIVWVGC
jgi:hypothetical protein